MTLTLILNALAVVCIVAMIAMDRLHLRAMKRLGYWQGRIDERAALVESSSATDYVFTSRTQIAEFLSEDDAREWADGVRLAE